MFLKRIAPYIIIVLFTMKGYGQSYLHYPDSRMMPAPGPEKYYNDSLQKSSINISSLPRIRYSINIGTSFSTGGFYGNTIQSWVAPEINYRVSDKLDLRFGVVASNNYMTNPISYNTTAEGVNNSASWFNYMVYAGGTYYVNENLVISGTIMKNFDQTPEWIGFSPNYNQDFESLSMSFSYRISDAFHIGADFRINRGGNPYMYNPTQPFGFQPYPMRPMW